MSKKMLFSFIASLLFLVIVTPSANADRLSSLDENIPNNIELVKTEEDLVVPLISTDPHEENFGGAVGGFTIMSNSTATSYVRSHGYKDVHEFKRAYLGEKAPISLYNLYYSKGSTRYVYILNSSNRGIKAYETYN
ncbi:hypothetical protein MHH37_15575 [Solibacillus sp. FSL K6-1781]|uniref:hypothetical protein n=1 Tax=Solibacillus sp. FSL K6-1781 TaxID=2921474 RepID=UPI00315A23E5